MSKSRNQTPHAALGVGEQGTINILLPEGLTTSRYREIAAALAPGGYLALSEAVGAPAAGTTVLNDTTGVLTVPLLGRSGGRALREALRRLPEADQIEIELTPTVRIAEAE